jgi:hypothetical protein
MLYACAHRAIHRAVSCCCRPGQPNCVANPICSMPRLTELKNAQCHAFSSSATNRALLPSASVATCELACAAGLSNQSRGP